MTHTAAIACPDCDLLLAVNESAPTGSVLRCPRCGAAVRDSGASDPQVTFAVAATGLVVFVPAVALPILQFTLAGQQGSNTLLAGVARLWQEGFPTLAMLVLLCSLAAPFIQLLATAVVTASQWTGTTVRAYPRWVKSAVFLQHWSMLEVYAIGILVAYVKMMDTGDVTIGSGTYCLAVLIVCLIATSKLFDSTSAWQHWEARQP